MQLSIFTKPWPTLPLPELARLVKSFNVDGIELPVRPNFQVTPENMHKELPAAVKIFADHGLKIFSIASQPNLPTIQAAAAAGVPIIRIMLPIDLSIGYLASIANFHKLAHSLIPHLDSHHVTLGLQNHCGNELTSAASLLHAIEPFRPKHIAAILDIAHCALSGEPEELAIDTVFDRLCMINLKNATRIRAPQQTSEPRPLGSDHTLTEAQWAIHWTPAREGFASWSKTIQTLKQRRCPHPLCLTAEYSDHTNVNQHATADVQYARHCLSKTELQS